MDETPDTRVSRKAFVKFLSEGSAEEIEHATNEFIQSKDVYKVITVKLSTTAHLTEGILYSVIIIYLKRF